MLAMPSLSTTSTRPFADGRTELVDTAVRPGYFLLLPAFFALSFLPFAGAASVFAAPDFFAGAVFLAASFVAGAAFFAGALVAATLLPAAGRALPCPAAARLTAGVSAVGVFLPATTALN